MSLEGGFEGLKTSIWGHSLPCAFSLRCVLSVCRSSHCAYLLSLFLCKMVSPSGSIRFDKPAHPSELPWSMQFFVLFCCCLFCHHEKIPEENNLERKHLFRLLVLEDPVNGGMDFVLGLRQADYHGSRDMLRRDGSPRSSQEMGERKSGLVVECFLLHFFNPGSHLLNGAVPIQGRVFPIRCCPYNNHLWNDPTDTPSPREGAVPIT